MDIYIVEDSAIIRGRTMVALSKIDGIKIGGASGYVNEAIDEISTYRPEIVILDIRLNDGTGIDVLQEIKKSIPNITVIMFTNYLYPQYMKKCTELGADYYFDKSKDFDKIINLISEKTLSA